MQDVEGLTMILRHGLSSKRVELPFLELARAVGLCVFCVAGSTALSQGASSLPGVASDKCRQRRELTFVERLTFTCPAAYCFIMHYLISSPQKTHQFFFFFPLKKLEAGR